MEKAIRKLSVNRKIFLSVIIVGIIVIVSLVFSGKIFKHNANGYILSESEYIRRPDGMYYLDDGKQSIEESFDGYNMISHNFKLNDKDSDETEETYKYTYDKKGNIVQCYHEAPLLGAKYIYNAEYDEKNNLNFLKLTYKKGNETIIPQKSFYEYDSNNNIIRINRDGYKFDEQITFKYIDYEGITYVKEERHKTCYDDIGRFEGTLSETYVYKKEDMLNKSFFQKAHLNNVGYGSNEFSVYDIDFSQSLPYDSINQNMKSSSSGLYLTSYIYGQQQISTIKESKTTTSLLYSKDGRFLKFQKRRNSEDSFEEISYLYKGKDVYYVDYNYDTSRIVKLYLEPNDVNYDKEKDYVKVIKMNKLENDNIKRQEIIFEEDDELVKEINKNSIDTSKLEELVITLNEKFNALGTFNDDAVENKVTDDDNTKDSLNEIVGQVPGQPMFTGDTEAWLTSRLYMNGTMSEGDGTSLVLDRTEGNDDIYEHISGNNHALGWYQVDKTTGEIIDFLTNEVIYEPNN